MVPWGWFPQLWRARLQVLNGQHNAADAILRGATQGTLSLHR
jgi:hypothetical protein